MLSPLRSSSKCGNRMTRINLAIICCQLILLACVANNTFHLWLSTSFGNRNIITVEALQHVQQGISTMLLLVQEHTSAIYDCKPLPSGWDCIQKLQHNFGQHHPSPISSIFYNFENTTVHWYCDLILDGRNPLTSPGRKIISLQPMALPPSTTLH
jgi:hypothetical protein